MGLIDSGHPAPPPEDAAIDQVAHPVGVLANPEGGPCGGGVCGSIVMPRDAASE
jgi:hypothetical protein